MHLNADIDKYKYSEYVIGFERRGVFSIGNGCGCNRTIFGVLQVLLYMLITGKNVLIIGKGPT